MLSVRLVPNIDTFLYTYKNVSIFYHLS